MSGAALTDPQVEEFFAWCATIQGELTRDEVAAAYPSAKLKSLMLRAKACGKIRRVGGGAATRWVSPTTYEALMVGKRERNLRLANARSLRWWQRERARIKAEKERDAGAWAECQPTHRRVVVWPPMAPPGPTSVFNYGSWV
jgi:hypothetical protein